MNIKNKTLIIYSLSFFIGCQINKPIEKTSWLNVTGDFDLDGDVDQSDFGLIQRCLSNSPYPPDCGKCDLDGDGDVDQKDISIFENNITGSNIPY